MSVRRRARLRTVAVAHVPRLSASALKNWHRDQPAVISGPAQRGRRRVSPGLPASSRFRGCFSVLVPPFVLPARCGYLALGRRRFSIALTLHALLPIIRNAVAG
jgi:hypothetical protein